MADAANETTASRIAVDPVSCEAVGLCAYLAPSLISLDRWGYPVLPRQVLGVEEERAGIRAARGCPRQALAVVPADARP
jgi:ferredoxin